MSQPVSRWLVPLLAFAFALAMALLSRGFLEPDEITHFLYARAALHDWRALTNIWGRLGATGLYALAAPLGPAGPRLLAVAFTGLTGLGTCRLLRQLLVPVGGGGGEGGPSFQRRHAAAFVWLLLLAQPCFLLNSFTVMTEMLLACAWVWALSTLAARRILLAGFLIGIGGLMRPEGWIAIAAWPIALALFARVTRASGAQVAARRLTLSAAAFSFFLSLLPAAAWYLLGLLAHHDPRWFIAAWPWSPQSQYGRNGILFALSSLTALAAWMWIPVALGAWSLRHARRTHPAFLLLVLPVAGLFLLHGTLGTLGLFGSMSLPRYFVAVAPLLAILALLGLLKLEARVKNWLPFTAVALSLAPAAALICFRCLPMQPTVEQQRLDVIVAELRARHVAADNLIAPHPYLLLQLDLNPDAPAQTRAFSAKTIAGAPAGTLLVADTTVWYYENRATPAQLASWGYRQDPAAAAAVDAIPERYEPLTLKASAADGARVRLWIKE